ncbi:AAA family ATPase [Sinorhizobium meliloti]|uniref:AAA family ATPase n=1 Tax=Rhizobium meliloti TaxID=382 RepID=UPI003704AAFC
MSDVIFARLEVGGWRQFDQVEIDLHDRLTVITGANGAGKSTLLGLLTQHFGWNRPYLGVPKKNDAGGLTYMSGWVKDILKRLRFRDRAENAVGSISYSDGEKCVISVAESGNYQVHVELANQRNVSGILIDSHRPTPYYSQVGSIPMRPMTAEQSFNNYNNEMLHRYQGSHTGSSPIYRMKESLISMAIFGEGNSRIGGANAAILETFDGFNQVLRDLLPESLGFREIAIRAPEVVLVTESGDFMLDASSGGIMTIIDTAWRIYMYSRDKRRFVVIMDEPENHLHPSMQRTLMGRLIKSFPQAQFVIATHSPFMVSSVKDSSVHVLQYKRDSRELSADVGISAGRKVFSQKISTTNMSATAAEVLREVLGVPATMPEWVEMEIEAIVARYRGQQLSSDMMAGMRADLANLGFGQYFAEAVGRLAGAR